MGGYSEDGAMSGGFSNNGMPAPGAEDAPRTAHWRSSPDHAGDRAAWEAVGSASHLPVELPSRRWYIEAADETGIFE